jgi:hypothetical protein
VRTLLIDIETAPNLAYVWALFDQNIAPSQLVESTEVICFAAKWLGEKKVHFYSVQKDGREAMIRAAHALLDEADVVMHYNGKRFDVPHLNREFLETGLKPPAPYQQIDLFRSVKAVFKFPSYKLEYVSQALGVGQKVKHSGFDLWVGCMAGDKAAWKLMEKYNKQDVVLLEELYEVLQAWIPQHPSHGAMLGQSVCPACGGTNLQRRGYAYTRVSAFRRYVCLDCGKWSRDTKRELSTGLTEVA